MEEQWAVLLLLEYLHSLCLSHLHVANTQNILQVKKDKTVELNFNYN